MSLAARSMAATTPASGASEPQSMTGFTTTKRRRSSAVSPPSDSSGPGKPRAGVFLQGPGHPGKAVEKPGNVGGAAPRTPGHPPHPQRYDARHGGETVVSTG